MDKRIISLNQYVRNARGWNLIFASSPKSNDVKNEKSNVKA